MSTSNYDFLIIFDIYFCNTQNHTPIKTCFSVIEKTHVSKCSLQRYLQELEYGSKVKVHQQMNG